MAIEKLKNTKMEHASVIVVIIPVAVLSLFVRKYLVRGLAFGSIK